jgi:DNA-directed RNA polymerase specialized sigma24 family protein
VAAVALARRDLLLRVHRHRLGREDLEDCYSQATLELLTRARAGPRLHGPGHIANALEQKFLSRIHDRRRALAGRSPIEAALAHAASLDGDDEAVPPLTDRSAAVHERVARRLDLGRVRELAAELTADQRLVLACQVGLDMGTVEFCQRYGWSAEKFRKVAQRARVRLTRLVEEYGSGERCRRLEADLISHVSRVATPEQAERVARHLANCAGCRRRVIELRVAEQRVVAVSPAALTTAGLAAGGAATGAGTGASALLLGGAGGLKAGLAALCVAGVTGGGLLLCQGVPTGPPRSRVATTPARAGVHHGRHPTRARPEGARANVAAMARPRRAAPRRPASPAAPARREFGFPVQAADARRAGRPAASTARTRPPARAGPPLGAPASPLAGVGTRRPPPTPPPKSPARLGFEGP